ncbi:MAG: 50S ribosomal protein L35 [Gemmatimonadetes bacterium]|jgi:large subunit ribosomal protein L35|nr:50S ribosomal protein L35 [Gemmatimonadota bacterium]MBT5057680.1 50S ribosomal protein L35 [Gemmatimonadota bacterium]MBT5144589.1 50S ribosomal protein L35 [Gemmatimonadota bacterium]MBT5587450.1 50S ribosomal protein L35 [Gemmatimonadota bacterium]MBT5962780.1 50S ribosomal protein L35 [Gemmatimonadota bacterium]
MPKLKTHKATAKRIKQRGSKSLKRRHAFGDHFLGKRSTKRKRQLRKNEAVSSANMKNVRRSLGLK